MGGKSGGGGTTTVNNTQPPQAVLDAYTSLINRGTQVASTPYQAYQGQQVAGLTPMQQQAFQNINNAQGAAQPYINQASTLANQSAQPVAGNIPQYNDANLQQYQSPYTQGVINSTMANINQNNAIQQQGLLGKAISSGASPFGGDRAGVAAAELARQQNLASGQTIAGLENQGFQNAQGEFNTQQQTQLSAQNADAARKAQAASIQGGLGLAAQGADLQGASAQLTGGTLEQQQNQAQLNVPYQQWQQQQAFPYQQTQWLGNLTEGLGSNSGGTSSSTAPGASNSQNYMNAGILGLGAAALLMNKGGRVSRARGGLVPHFGEGGSPGLGNIINGDDQGSDYLKLGEQLLPLLLAKNGGSIHQTKDNIMPHYASGGNTPYDISSWIPEIGGLSVGHTMPTAPHAAQPASNTSMASLGSMMSSMGKGKSGGLGGGFLDKIGSGLGGSSDPNTPTIDMSNYNNGGQYTSNYNASSDWGGVLGGAASDGSLSSDSAVLAMKKGGLVPHYDDGGDVNSNDDTYEMASEDIPALGYTMASNMPSTMPQAPTAGSQDITPANNPGLAIASQNPQVETAQKPSLGMALMAAGAAGLAGNSPHWGQNLGQVAMGGMKNYAQQQQAINAAQKEKALEQHEQSMDAKPQMVTSGQTIQMLYPQEKDPKTGKKGLLVDTGIPTTAWAAQEANAPLRAAQAEYYKNKADDGKFSFTPGIGQDDKGQQVPGTWIQDAKSGEATFKPGMVTTPKGAASPAATTGLPTTPEGLIDEGKVPSQVQQQAKAMIEGRAPYPTGMMLKQPMYQQALALAQQQDPQYDSASAPARASTYKKFTSGKSSDELNALNTSLGHYDSLMNAWQKLDNTDYPIINSVKNKTSQQLGKGELSAFAQARTLLAPELMKAYGAGHSVAETQEFAKNFSPNASPEQQKQVLDMGANLMQSKIQSLQDSYERGMGTVNGFDKISKIGPKGVATLKALGLDTSKYNLPDTSAGSPAAQVSNAQPTLPAGIPAGSTLAGQSQGKDVYVTPDGKHLRVD